ncbi:uncharacterized protein LOC116116012 [Pistacia vera]|uniref:uncharacterized protein LOC116116012 n=1 Tax=Pistacia vera TaxID=55513 RepID=UPI001262AF52|nr:uncharacterized protein LOC116116012 [Pistacia vera]
MLLDDSQILEIIRKPWSVILEAAKQGNLAFLNIIFCAYPDLMFEVDENHCTIFHYAVMYRHSSIFRIIYDIGSLKDLIIKNTDEEGNNILHLAAKLPPPDRPNNIESAGALYHLQRELLWFKAVKNILHPVNAEATNKKGKTARDLFTEQHKDLKDKAEKLAKDIDKCMHRREHLLPPWFLLQLLRTRGNQ